MNMPSCAITPIRMYKSGSKAQEFKRDILANQPPGSPRKFFPAFHPSFLGRGSEKEEEHGYLCGVPVHGPHVL